MKKFKKLTLLVASIVGVTAPLAGCDIRNPIEEQKDVAVTSINVDVSSVNLEPNQTKTLGVTVLPENATNKGVTYTSSDSTIASVSDAGVITAIKDGVCVITVQSAANPALTKFVTVNVKTAHVSVASITLNKKTIELIEGSTEALTVTVLPADATDKSVTFSSTNNDVAEVSNSGVITAKAQGIAVINVFSVDNPGVFEQATVNVKKGYVAVESVISSQNEVTVKVGSVTQIPVTVAPEDATNKALTWTSSNEDVAIVNEEGVVTTKAVGTTKITVKSVDNPACSQEITLKVESEVISVTGVTLDKQALSIAENGDKQTLVATVAPADASNKALIWSSSDEEIATVNANGEVKPVKAGTARITVKTADGEFEAHCDVTITKVDLVSITLNESAISFSVAATGADKLKQLTAILNPEEPTYTKVIWSSSNQDVATVTSTGLVEMVGEGTCVIMATHENSNKQASCTVTVNKVAATAITLDQSELYFLTMSGDATKQLTATLTPENVTHKELTWSSSNTSVATVDSNGLVTRVGEGEATITVKHIDSNLEATCDVYVTASSVYTIRGVEPAANYVKYNQNKGQKVNPLTEFVNHDLIYQVGDDNKLSFAPVLKLYKGKQQVSQDLYEGGYNFSVEKKINASYVPADASEFEVVEKTAEIDFAQSAVGNSYKLTVCPKDIDEEDIEDFTQVYLVEVIDGYNVTKEEELSLFDTTTNSYAYQDNELHSGWESFKEEHGIDKNLHPSTLILHKDLMITKDKLPGNFFYSAEDAANYGWSQQEKDKSLGSLKDYIYLFVKNTAGNIKVTGNYFAIDWSQIPLVNRAGTHGGDPARKLNSHSSVFRIENGSMDFENVNLIGNAHVAKTDADIKFDGGLIGFKIYDKTTVANFKNILEHGCYIGIMTEGGVNPDDLHVADVNVVDSKFYDNNNSFLYNWGGVMNVKNSLFEGCGGPVIIQDHSRVKNIGSENAFDYIDNGKFVINGCDPKTVFEDCTINNYVIGTESWFKSFGAEGLAPQIKAMSDSLYSANASAGRTFAYDTDQKGVITQMATTDTLMNFIVLNKSSDAEGITAYPVDGEVIFIKNGVVTEDFNYFRPTDMADASEPELNRFTAEATFNKYFRGVQAAGAPVFETAGGSYCIANESPLTLATVDSTAIHGLNAAYPLNTDVASVVSGAKDNIALYYKGMMLVFGLGYIGQ